MMDFEMSQEDQKLIWAIVRKIREEMPSIDSVTVMMDLSACHAEGCALDLERMLDAEVDELWHDIHGINRHLDRETGQLVDCFLPRFSKKGGVTVAKKRYFMFFKRETSELFFYDRRDKAICVTKIKGDVPFDSGYPLQDPYFSWTTDMMLDFVIDCAHISPSLCEAINTFVGEEGEA